MSCGDAIALFNSSAALSILKRAARVLAGKLGHATDTNAMTSMRDSACVLWAQENSAKSRERTRLFENLPETAPE